MCIFLICLAFAPRFSWPNICCHSIQTWAKYPKLHSFQFSNSSLKNPPQSITFKLSDLILELTLKNVRSIIAIMHKSSSNGPKIRFFLTLCEIVCAQRRMGELHIQVVGWVNGDGKSGLRWFDGVSVGPFDRIVSLHYDVLELRDVMSCLPPNDFQTRSKAY